MRKQKAVKHKAGGKSVEGGYRRKKTNLLLMKKGDKDGGMEVKMEDEKAKGSEAQGRGKWMEGRRIQGRKRKRNITKNPQYLVTILGVSTLRL